MLTGNRRITRISKIIWIIRIKSNSSNHRLPADPRRIHVYKWKIDILKLSILGISSIIAQPPAKTNKIAPQRLNKMLVSHLGVRSQSWTMCSCLSLDSNPGIWRRRYRLTRMNTNSFSNLTMAPRISLNGSTSRSQIRAGIGSTPFISLILWRRIRSSMMGWCPCFTPRRRQRYKTLDGIALAMILLTIKIISPFVKFTANSWMEMAMDWPESSLKPQAKS